MAFQIARPIFTLAIRLMTGSLSISALADRAR
jgi:hypothetical protein